jgi:hypothetical protein
MRILPADTPPKSGEFGQKVFTGDGKFEMILNIYAYSA